MNEISQNAQEWQIKKSLKACTSAKFTLDRVRECVKRYRPEERRRLVEDAVRAGWCRAGSRLGPTPGPAGRPHHGAAEARRD